MKLSISEGISLKEAWARIKGSAPSAEAKGFDNPDTTEERAALGIPAKEGE